MLSQCHLPESLRDLVYNGMELTWSSKICDNQIYYTEVYFIAFWNLKKSQNQKKKDV